MQEAIREPLVYGSEHGPVMLTVRRHHVADGEGHLSPHYDIISYDAPAILSYEELTAGRLDGYREFLQSCISADPSIGTTQLIGMLETTHAVSAQTRTMQWWRDTNLPVSTPMADLPLNEAMDAYDALFGPSSEAPIETATADAVIAIDDTDSTIPAAVELAAGAMDSCIGGIGGMTNSVHG